MQEQSPFIWHELVTADQPVSGAFFIRLLGWTCREVDAVSLGGNVVVAPHDVPGVGRICAVADPTGAVAHLMQPVAR